MLLRGPYPARHGVGETRRGPLSEHAMQAQGQRSTPGITSGNTRPRRSYQARHVGSRYCAGKPCEPGNVCSRPPAGCFNWQIAPVSQPFVDGHSRQVRQGLALKVGMALKISSQCRRQDHGLFIPPAATSPVYCRLASALNDASVCCYLYFLSAITTNNHGRPPTTDHCPSSSSNNNTVGLRLRTIRCWRASGPP